MSSATLSRRTSATPPDPARRDRRTRRAGDVAVALAGVGLGLVVGIQIATSTGVEGPGALLIELSRWAGLLGTYLALLVIFLVARVPVVERAVGMDRMISWHRKLGPLSLVLVAAHVVLVTAGYGASAATSFLSQSWTFVTVYPWVLPAFAGFVLMLVAGVTSWRVARRQMKYETWWVTHLYFYLAIALAYLHQITLGQPFATHTWARWAWIGLYVITFVPLVVFRVAAPLWLSLRHNLKVHAVVRENADTISIWVSGRHLAALDVQGGQFFGWRFLTRHRWWQSHPYSLSIGQDARYLRITVKDLGDHSRSLASLKPGTRVVAEGPYGIFTAEERRTDRVVLIAGGVGVAPIRSLLDDLPKHVAVDILFRASHQEGLVLREELEAIARSRQGVRLRYLVGSRRDYPMNARTLLHLVPDVRSRDIYTCGPDALVEAVREASQVLKMPADQVHDDSFSFQSPAYYSFTTKKEAVR
jgi:predicted ferric reductase